MYLRIQQIELEKLNPGSLVVHFANDNKIRKHELHFYGKGIPVEEILDKNLKVCIE